MRKNNFSRFLNFLFQAPSIIFPNYIKRFYIPLLRNLFGNEYFNDELKIECVIFGESPGYAEGAILGCPFFLTGYSENNWRIEITLSSENLMMFENFKNIEQFHDGPFESFDQGIYTFGSTSDLQISDFQISDIQDKLISSARKLKEKLKK